MLSIKTLEAAIDLAVKDVKHPSRIGPVIAAVVGRELVKELGHLEARLDELERTAMVWAGPHDVAKDYVASDVVQRGGSLWIALVDVKAGDLPGSASWRRLATSKL